MANQYDTNLKLQAIADAIGDAGSSGLIQALEDIADAVAGGGGGGSSTAGLVSDNFSETDTYDLGDYCIHNNTLYVCINAITTPGPWDLSDWQATNAGIQLSSLNSALTNRTTTTLTGTIYVQSIDSPISVVLMGKIAFVSANINKQATSDGASLLYGLPAPKQKVIVPLIGNDTSGRGYIDANDTTLKSYAVGAGWYGFNICYEVA